MCKNKLFWATYEIIRPGEALISLTDQADGEWSGAGIVKIGSRDPDALYEAAYMTAAKAARAKGGSLARFSKYEPSRKYFQGGKRRHGGGSKKPSWKKIVVLKGGVPIHKTRKYWQVLNHYLDFGQAPAGYEVKLPGSVVNSLGMAEEVERRSAKRSRKRTSVVVSEAGAAEPQLEKLAGEVADLLR